MFYLLYVLFYLVLFVTNDHPCLIQFEIGSDDGVSDVAAVGIVAAAVVISVVEVVGEAEHR